MKVRKKLMSLVLAGIMAVMSCGSLASSAKELPDPNGDGVLNMSDAVLIMQYLVGYLEPTDLSKLDADRNGVISQMDAFRIQLYEAHLYEESGLV